MICPSSAAKTTRRECYVSKHQASQSESSSKLEDKQATVGEEATSEKE